MEKIRLERTGERPLEFEGDKIAYATSETVDGPGQNRYWELSLFKTKSDAFCLSIEFHTSWQGELDTSFAVVEETIEAIEDHIRLYEPLEQFAGYPPGQQYDEKREYLHRVLGTGWKSAVSELLKNFPEEL